MQSNNKVEVDLHLDDSKLSFAGGDNVRKESFYNTTVTHDEETLTIANDATFSSRIKDFGDNQEMNNEHVVRALVDGGADVNRTNNEGNTALFYAVQEWNTESMVHALIDVGADINRTDNYGRTPFLYAVQEWNNESVIHALIDAGADVNKTDNEGKTALNYAVQEWNNESVVRALIDAGADVNRTDNEGKTPLLYAVQEWNNESVVRALIDAGADVNKTDNEGKTALNYAVQEWNTESMVHALIDGGVDINRTDNEGKTALNYAVQEWNNESVVRALIDAGADVNKTDNEGKTALNYAVQEWNESVVRALIDAGADVNKTDNEGKTALFYAVMNDGITVAIALVEGGAEVNARDACGRSPLFYSMRSLKLASYLLASGANLGVRDRCNVSVFSFLFSKYIDSDSSFIFPADFNSQFLHWVMSQEIPKATVLESILNVVFCKSPLLVTSETVLRGVVDVLVLAKECTSNFFGEIRRKISKILNFLKKETSSGSKVTSHLATIIPKIMILLIDLGANPATADSDGNTALHYATALSFCGASHEVIMKILSQLESLGVHFSVKNKSGETPLLFCMSAAVQEISQRKSHTSGLKILVIICRFLLRCGSSVEEFSRNGESIYHLMLELFQKILQTQHDQNMEEALRETRELFTLLFSERLDRRGNTVNRPDFHLNSPLHKWASLEIGPDSRYTDILVEKQTFGDVLEAALQCLLKCGAKLNARNENDETPLHLCKTWTAVNLLLDAGANPNDMDSSGRTPLLVAAKREMNNDNLYPDVLSEPKVFWRTALKMGLDPWTVDQHGESVLSVLVGANRFCLSQALVEVACEDSFVNSGILFSLLNAICKDKSPDVYWKVGVVEVILRSRKLSGCASLHIPLLSCCRNILDSDCYLKNTELGNPPLKTSKQDSKPDLKGPAFKKVKKSKHSHEDKNGETAVHWTLAKQLLLYGADCNAIDSSGQSCLDIAEECPALKELLIAPTDLHELPMWIPWTAVSEIHQSKLAKVARHLESEQVGSYCYHKDPLAIGSFGAVFAGISEKDGREVAIKRIVKIRMKRPEDKREITNLTSLADCEQVVRYLHFFEDEHFSYVVLELMEGDLDQLLVPAIPMNTKVSLCQDVVKGLKHLHNHHIVHRDLKPTNLLYKTHPKLCLKIADFGLSRRIDTTGSTTVYGTNAGTRCWIAPEVLTATKDQHSTAADMFSCGLVLHYILSAKKHPFSPEDCANKSEFQIRNETERNLIHGNKEGWDNSLSPEAAILLEQLLEGDATKRPTSTTSVAHPLFWSNTKKLDLLIAVGNQPEFECPRAKRTHPLTAVEADLDASFSTIVRYGVWNDPGYVQMPAIYREMTRIRKRYDTHSVVELVRFIRNAISRVSGSTQPTPIRKQILEDFMFLDYFPNLVIEVYKAVTKHGWDRTREEIKYAMEK